MILWIEREQATLLMDLRILTEGALRCCDRGRERKSNTLSPHYPFPKMPLHLAHHKSYHPYSKSNIEKVRKDEEIQQELERIQSLKSLDSDSHFRLQQLRRQREELQSNSSKDKRIGGNDRLKAAEQEVLHGKKGSLEKWDQRFNSRVGAQDFKGQDDTKEKEKEKRDGHGHINFWQDLESGDSIVSRREMRPKKKGRGDHRDGYQSQDC